MNLPPPTSEPLSGPDAAGQQSEDTPSRSGMSIVGLPAILAVVVVSVALGGVTILSGAGDDAVRTSDAATTSISSTTTSILDDVFTSAGVTVESAATPITQAPITQAPITQAPTSEAPTSEAPTTRAPFTTPTTTTSTTTAPTTTTTTATSTTTSSTLAPTTTLAPVSTAATLPEQPAQPIAPPTDARGAEDQIQLGGISIPKLGLDAPLFEGIRLTTIDNGPGHWPGTAMPGQVGNVVVAAHRTSHGGPFRNIDQLVSGDSVMFDTDAGEIEYMVTGTQIVDPDAIWIVDPTDTPTATLFACHPPGSTAQRIVVNLELAL